MAAKGKRRDKALAEILSIKGVNNDSSSSSSSNPTTSQKIAPSSRSTPLVTPATTTTTATTSSISSSSTKRTSRKSEVAISPALTAWIATQENMVDKPQQALSALKESQQKNNSMTASDNSITVAAATTFTTFTPQKEDVPEDMELEDDDIKNEGNSNRKGSSRKQLPRKRTSVLSSRRERQSARQVAEEQREDVIQTLLTDLQVALQADKRNIDDILRPIRSLLQHLPTTSSNNNSLRQLMATRNPLHYRLTWVGSDDAVCYIGTGLHKVPLARLQEVFLTLPGRNTVRIQEVIRILGPFPNIKNTLQGTCNLDRHVGGGSVDTVMSRNSKDDSMEVVDWTITWDSMVDGTGKELLAGKQDNLRVVPLHVYWSTPSLIVAVVPPPLQDDNDNEDHGHRPRRQGRCYREDPLEDNGKHVLLFVREDDLDTKLEQLRVAEK